MKSITIHGVDEQHAEVLRSRARSEGLSLNKMIKKPLEESLGVKPRHKETNRTDFEEFCGMWPESDLREFEKKQKDSEESTLRTGSEKGHP